MGNETEKDMQHKSGGPEQGHKNQPNEGHNPTQQDPSKKNPSQGQDPRQRQDEGSENIEKRRAS